MAESSPAIDAIARKSHGAALRGLQRTGQNVVAESLGISASTVSRFCSEHDGLERAIKILAAAGLKVVPTSYQCFEPRKVAILMELARDHLNTLQHVDQLGLIDED